MTQTAHEKPPAGHIHTKKGHVRLDKLKKKVEHHERIARAIDITTGRVVRSLITTRHTEYHDADGEMVRRDIHINADESTPHVAHDVAPTPTEPPNQPLQRSMVFQKPEGASRVYLQLEAFGPGAGAATLSPWFNPFDELLERIRRGLAILVGITTALLTSFKKECLQAKHDFTVAGSTFKLALFKAQALLTGTYDASTTNYSDMTGNNDELANGNGYTTGGVTLTNTTPLTSGTTAYTTPNGDATWTSSTFTSRGCLAYNSSQANKGWFVYDFGADEPVVSGTFTISWPANAVATAMTRLA